MLTQAMTHSPCSTARAGGGVHQLGGESPQLPRGLAELATTILPFGTPPPAPAPGQVDLHLRARQGHVGQSALLVVGGLLRTRRRAAEGHQALLPASDEDHRPLAPL